MDTKSVLALIEQLEENLEDLEDNLEPLLSDTLAVTTLKLPLLERAKLNVLLVYAIESLIFSYLKTHGVQAKEHPVFRELSRVKQYFEKIKAAETAPSKPQPNLVLDKDAAGRFIKHALAGNDKYDLERREREAREKLLAKRRLKDLENIMKGKATANGQNRIAADHVLRAEAAADTDADADADADALAAAHEAAKLIAMEEGEVHEESEGHSMSTSLQEDDAPSDLGSDDSASHLSTPESSAHNPVDVNTQTSLQNQPANEKPKSSSNSSNSALPGPKRRSKAARAQRIANMAPQPIKATKTSKKAKKKATKQASRKGSDAKSGQNASNG